MGYLCVLIALWKTVALLLGCLCFLTRNSSQHNSCGAGGPFKCWNETFPLGCTWLCRWRSSVSCKEGTCFVSRAKKSRKGGWELVSLLLPKLPISSPLHSDLSRMSSRLGKHMKQIHKAPGWLAVPRMKFCLSPLPLVSLRVPPHNLDSSFV